MNKVLCLIVICLLALFPCLRLTRQNFYVVIFSFLGPEFHYKHNCYRLLLVMSWL